MSRKLSGALLALGFVGFTAAPAQADPLLPGCYGAGPAIVCDVTVGAETYETSIEVCAGTCRDVEVTLVRTTDGGCMSYTERSGEVHRTCALYSYSDDYYPWARYSGTCSEVDVADDARQALCLDTYHSYQTGQSDTCVNAYGRLDRQVYCY